jgi:general secretion pathway protein J
MESIEGFLVECYDGGIWVKSWNTDINYSLPKAVRVTVMIKEGAKTVSFSTTASPRINGS